MNNPYSVITFLRNIFLCLLLVSFYSCDTSNYVDYNIINSTSGSIKVTYNKWTSNNSITNDTTIFLLPNQKQTVITRDLFASGAFNPEGGDTIWMFPKLLLYKNDTIPSAVNLKTTKYWNYNGISKHHGELILNVYDSYFQ
jgi:hypothetical protein